MTATLESVFQEALALPDSERMELVERLIPTIQDEPEIEAEQLREVSLRIEQTRLGTVETIPGEAVLREVRDSLAAMRRA